MINPNDPAFPQLDWDQLEAGQIIYRLIPGPSLRTELAARAMQALISAGCIGGKDVALDAVGYADALINELNK